MKNCYFATKVAFCNEIETFCKKMNVNYCTISSLVTLDPRIHKSYTMVPGYDGSRGFGGNYLPRDIKVLSKEYHYRNIRCDILDSVIKRNNEIDRKKNNNK